MTFELSLQISGDHSSVESYQLVYTCEEAELTHVVSLPPSDSTVDGLLPHCNYSFQIHALGAQRNTMAMSEECRSRTPEGESELIARALPCVCTHSTA